ncbi:Uma2 family endonuclease [Streptomyces orinoci]|uniref:Uma2 family endonuclease n=1 Tax=Streptomyces orinoci TaxID=67339 RepID=A0ABV3K2Z1_STRON|nr:Uma2 family endonuclease [Streptomyces orinoci]
MTPRSVNRPQMTVEEFEQLARSAPETVRLEFINGKIGVKQVPDGYHGDIIRWLQKLCMQHRPDLWLYGEQGLKVESYRKGRAIADGALAPDKHTSGQGEWLDPDGILMVVEVTSNDSDTDQRDRRDKPHGYAQAGIPVYLLIDREYRSVTVHAGLADGVYRDITTRPYGTPVELPAPVGFKLDTEELKEYTD